VTGVILAYASFPDSGVAGVLWAIGPTIAVGLVFWFVMRAIIRSDRNERAAQAKYEALEEARLAAASEHPAA
jgi:flagellar biosynthesis/type III secretory pathway M-ring protein FliF/YscJ